MGRSEPLLTLGIDPGTSILGYGLVRKDEEALFLVDHGVIVTPKGASLPRKLVLLYDQISSLIASLRPKDLAVERLFFSKNARTAFAVGQARGVVLLAGEKAGLPIYEYTPLEVKHSVVGYGRATKRQVQELLVLLLGLNSLPEPDDAADAIAVAFCHLQCQSVAQLVAEGADL